MSKKFAVILSGCGFLDGSEISESVLTLLALSQANVNYQAVSVSINQHHSINHVSQNEEKNNRNVMEESARIARGNIIDIKDTNPSEFSGVIIPGGYGVAKNLCSFAFKGAQATVNEDIKKFLLEFKRQEKPIGAICISPALIALLLGNDEVKLTIGDDKETSSEIQKTGAKHNTCTVDKICIDKKLKVVSTPAYMYSDASLDKIYLGIKSCVDKVIELSPTV